ncbi:hypothetical protein DJ533_01435 (plasmid) [Acinetobacter defluvii]|uniref:Uncharacterized protein n=1 Tax=Acinetobacter defluvii TaxID=1871111 RepID=A0A2S2F8U3_9GAMM|nr:hypothetical protein [Acinetobacter defluvii]AWL27359.1 hypothetical protein DJ533_01435 [Acinetobacter defluvii]
MKEISEKQIILFRNAIIQDDFKLKKDTIAEIENYLSQYIDMFKYDTFKPYWLLSKNYDDLIWEVKTLEGSKLINFSKILSISDNPIWYDLINLSKLWIAISCTPKYNNSVLLKIQTITPRINRICNLIDCLINNRENLQLEQRGLLALDSNFFHQTLINIATLGLPNAIYNYEDVIKNHILNAIKDINIDDVIAFENKIKCLKLHNSGRLKLTETEIRKAKYYFFMSNAYSDTSNYEKKLNSNFFLNLFPYSLYLNYHTFPTFSEFTIYYINHNYSDTEFERVPIVKENNNHSLKTIERYLLSLNHLNIVIDLEYNYLRKINININQLFHSIEKIPLGRFKLLPAEVVFDSFRNAFEFTFNYIDNIHDSLINIYENLNISNIDISEKKFFLKYINNELLDLGVESWTIKKNNDFYINLRKNKGLHHLYAILTASICILIGTLLARRQSEILDLDPFDSLYPNIDPTANNTIHFYLKVKNSKTGVGLLNNLKEYLNLPIPLSIAIFIYKTQKFNKKISKINPNLINSLNLFNAIHSDTMSVSKLSSKLHYNYLNTFCDYFETQTIDVGSLIKKRYYIRQHQLRRFFAMLFFWSKKFDSLNILTKFLGHTNSEHLYNYISESTPGDILLGVKAHYLSDYFLNKNNNKYDIENISSLESILKKHFNIDFIDFMTEEKAATLYENSQKNLQESKLHDIEDLCFILLKESIIDLRPDFYIITDRKTGKTIKEFKLILLVNENE